MANRSTYRFGSFLALSFWMMFGATASHAQLLPSLGGERAGTSGYQFLKIPVDARGAALGETVVASANDASSLYWNPALAAQAMGVQAALYHTEYYVDVTLDYAGLIYPIRGTNIVLGASVQTMNSGEMEVTTEFQPFGTGETFALRDYAVGLTFAQKLTDLFSYGVTSRYIRESVAGVSTSLVAFDMGFYYEVGASGFRMAVSLRNFGIDAVPDGSIERMIIGDPSTQTETEFESMTPPTIFNMGVMYEVFQDHPNRSLELSTQLNNPNDNAENWNMGAEYGWRETLFLRMGYRFSIEEYTMPSFGAGFLVPMGGPSLRFDYGFNRLERLGNVHRVGLNLGL